MLIEIFKKTGLFTSMEKDFINVEMIEKLGEDECHSIFSTLLNKLSTSPAFTTVRVNTILTTASKIRQSLKEKLPGFEVVVHPLLPEVLVIFPLLELAIPVPQPNELIVSLKCGLSVLRGASVFAPGVLGANKNLKKNDVVAVYCDLDGKCLRGATKIYTGKKYFLGNGVALWNRRELFVSEIANGCAVEMTEPIKSLPSLNGILPNSLFLQNLPSIVCGHILNPKPGDLILDMCAAPGGKSTHIAALTNNQAVIIALDKSENKIRNIKMNAERLKLICIHTFVFDATKSYIEDCNRVNILNGPPYDKETFDKILLDAPCSCLGQRPQLINQMTPNEFVSFPKVQRKMLRNAVHLVKPGGTVVYSTCTFTLQENEVNVKWVLDNFPQMQLVEQVPFLGEPGLYGAELDEENRLKIQRFGLSSLNDTTETDTICFFIAKFTKV
ncbi:Putative methyltransferase nsun6 [Chamberlinius hualienensis]